MPSCSPLIGDLVIQMEHLFIISHDGMLDVFLVTIQFQIVTQLFQNTCTKHLALVRVTLHSERVMYAAAVTRYLHRSHIKRF